MKRRIVLVVVIGLVLPLTVYGQTPAGEKSTTVSLDMTEAYLEDALKLLSKQSGLNLVASEEVRSKKVTIFLDRVPAQAALESILKANRLEMKEQGANLYLIIPSAVPSVATVTRVFPLKYARVTPSAGEILPTFGLSGSLITTSFSTSGTGGASTTGTGTGGVAGATGAGGYGGGGGLGGIGGLGGQGRETGMLQIIRSLLTEHGSVGADPRTNSLIVTEIPERMKMIEETVAKLDVKPTQILIEAEVLEVTLDTLRRLGVEYGTSTGQIGSYLGAKRALFLPFNAGQLEGATESHTLGTLSFADASILFKLLATEKDVKFLARPRLLTLSNEVAEIRIVADAATGVTSTSQATTGTVKEEVERNTVGTILRVTPMVNEDRYVTMVIEPEVSRALQSATFSSFLDPTRRAARTTVMAPDNGTVMIAGLISTEDTQAARRIPGLGDLPILGLPFKRTETERKSTEIILFITPHIVREEAPLTLALDREQPPFSPQERQVLEFPHGRVLRRRAWNETIENILR